MSQPIYTISEQAMWGIVYKAISLYGTTPYAFGKYDPGTASLIMIAPFHLDNTEDMRFAHVSKIAQIIEDDLETSKMISEANQALNFIIRRMNEDRQEEAA